MILHDQGDLGPARVGDVANAEDDQPAAAPAEGARRLARYVVQLADGGLDASCGPWRRRSRCRSGSGRRSPARRRPARRHRRWFGGLAWWQHRQCPRWHTLPTERCGSASTHLHADSTSAPGGCQAVYRPDPGGRAAGSPASRNTPSLRPDPVPERAGVESPMGQEGQRESDHPDRRHPGRRDRPGSRARRGFGCSTGSPSSRADGSRSSTSSSPGAASTTSRPAG